MDEATRIRRQYFYPYYCPIPIRALFIYENTWNISFDIDSGRIRMLNNQKENRYISLFVMILFRAVYRVLFLYMFLSARKGCYSTALEISKCLYSQDPQLDHQGAMLLLGILRLSLITNRLLYGLYNAWYYTVENGLDSTLPTYYGNSTEWIKFKNCSKEENL